MSLKRRMVNECVDHIHIGVLPSGKCNDILNFAWKWMEIENALMIELIKTQKDKYGMY